MGPTSYRVYTLVQPFSPSVKVWCFQPFAIIYNIKASISIATGFYLSSFCSCVCTGDTRRTRSSKGMPYNMLHFWFHCSNVGLSVFYDPAYVDFIREKIKLYISFYMAHI